MAVRKSDRELADALTAGLDRNGGATVSVWAGVTPTEGYVVAVPGCTERLRNVDDTRGAVAEYLQRHACAARRTGYVGIWADGRDAVLDVVEIYGEAAPAIAAGRARGEIAIFCLTDGTEIPTSTPEQAAARRASEV